MSMDLHPPLWLPGGHLQTIWPALRSGPSLPWRRHRILTPDHDFIDFDWLDGRSDHPVLVLFHGLEGSARSHYARSLMQACHDAGWTGVVPHFRGCSGTPNLTARAYHCGDGQEIGWMLEQVSAQCPGRELFAVGVSLGGSALLNWLANATEAARPPVRAAAAVSVPLDLPAVGRRIDRGLNRWLYARTFLRTLIPKAVDKLTRAGRKDMSDTVRRARTLERFDDLYTAPVHGFKDAQDYWQQAATLPKLTRIHIPTLILNARNDPFLTPGCFPAADQLPDCIHCLYPPQGGHAGFMQGPFPGQLTWLPQQLFQFFGRIMAGQG